MSSWPPEVLETISGNCDADVIIKLVLILVIVIGLKMIDSKLNLQNEQIKGLERSMQELLTSRSSTTGLDDGQGQSTTQAALTSTSKGVSVTDLERLANQIDCIDRKIDNHENDIRSKIETLHGFFSSQMEELVGKIATNEVSPDIVSSNIGHTADSLQMKLSKIETQLTRVVGNDKSCLKEQMGTLKQYLENCFLEVNTKSKDQTKLLRHLENDSFQRDEIIHRFDRVELLSQQSLADIGDIKKEFRAGKQRSLSTCSHQSTGSVESGLNDGNMTPTTGIRTLNTPGIIRQDSGKKLRFRFRVSGVGIKRAFPGEEQFSDVWDVGLPRHDIRGKVHLCPNGGLRVFLKARRRRGAFGHPLSGENHIRLSVTALSEDRTKEGWLVCHGEDVKIGVESEGWLHVWETGYISHDSLKHHVTMSTDHKLTLKYNVTVL